MKRQLAIASLAIILGACSSSRGTNEGSDGSTGTDGTAATDGTTGTEGTDGTTGTTSTDGTDGTDGTTGTTGTDGTTGTTGTDGTDGTTGIETPVTISEAQNSTESTGCLEASCMCDYQGGPKACGSAICNLKQNDVLRLKGVVIASKSFYVSGALNGVYVADPAATGAAYSGIAVTYNSEWTVDFQPGDTYDMDVRLKEAFCNTQFELANLKNLSKVATAAVPPAKDATASDFASATAEAEKWEGMRVKLTNLTIKSHESGNTIMTEEGVIIDDAFSIWFSGGSWTPPPVGTKITEVSGFVSYSHNAYQIQPETEGDIVLDIAEKVMTLGDIQTSDASTMCPAPNCGGNGNFCSIEPKVTVENLVAVSDVFVVSDSSNLRGFFVTHTSGEWSNNAILVVFDHDDLPIGASTVAEGTAITSLTAEWEEIFCVSQLVLSSADDLVTDGTATVPAPGVATLDDLSLANGEPLESALVTVTGPFTVDSVETGNGLVTLMAANDASIAISNSFDLWAEGTFPTTGTVYASITGFVRYFRDADGDGSNWYISPADAGDLPLE